LNVEPTVGSTPPWAGVTPAPGDKKDAGRPYHNLSLSEERSARAEGERRERCNACRRNCARLFVVESLKVVLLSGGGPGISELRLDELAFVRCQALHLTRRHRFSSGFRRPPLGQGEVSKKTAAKEHAVLAGSRG
jgi:hypothetical protein